MASYLTPVMEAENYEEFGLIVTPLTVSPLCYINMLIWKPVVTPHLQKIFYIGKFSTHKKQQKGVHPPFKNIVCWQAIQKGFDSVFFNNNSNLLSRRFEARTDLSVFGPMP